LEPGLEQKVWELEEGEFTEVLSTKAGFHIFKLDNHVPAIKMAYDEVKGRIHKRLTSVTRTQVLEQIFNDLFDLYKATYSPDLLDGNYHELEPDMVLFNVDDRHIFVTDLVNYIQTTSFNHLRESPPKEWLKEQSLGMLFLWHAEQLQMDESEEFQSQFLQEIDEYKYGRMLSERVQKKIEKLKTEGELRKHYESFKQRFSTAKTHRVHLITVGFDYKVRPLDIRDELEVFAKDIREGRRTFEEVAKEISTDPSAGLGGELGWILYKNLREWAGPRAQPMLSELKVGDVSEPFLIEEYVQSKLKYERKGYGLVMIDEIREPRRLTFEESEDRVISHYIKHNQNKLLREITNEVLNETQLKIFEDRL